MPHPIRLIFWSLLAAGVAVVALPAAAADRSFANAEVIELHNGLNRVDINGDGRLDLIVKSRRRNFNAHSYSAYSFFVQFRDKYYQNNDWFWALVPVKVGKYSSHDFHTSEGADCILSDIKVLRQPNAASNALSIIQGDRAFGESYADENSVTFSLFELKHNDKGIPGWPDFYFERVETFSSSARHCDIYEAFARELGIR